MKKLLFLIIVSLVLASSASAYNAWAPGDPLDANWNIPGNWTLGYVPITSDEVRFVDSEIPCLIDSDTDAVCLQIKAGDNGANELEHELTIEGSLTTYTTDSWSATGYNRSATINVEHGGSFTNGYRMGIGLVVSINPTVPSVLNVNGGDVTLGGNLQVGTDKIPGIPPFPDTPGHIGIVNVNGGTLEATGIEMRDSTGNWSFVNIGLGTLTIGGNWSDDLDDAEPPVAQDEFPTWIANGAVTAFAELAPYGLEGDPDVVYDENRDVTILTADDPLDRSPENDSYIQDGAVTLSWINLPNPPSNDVWVDVWYGTDPSYDPNTGTYGDFTRVLNDSQNTTAYGTSSSNNTYYWRVDTHLSDPASDPNVVEGYLMAFIATNDSPPTNVEAGFNMVTWADNETQLGGAVQAGGTYDDDGVTPAEVTWSCGADPNTWFNDGERGAPVVGDASPTVTCDAVKDVELTFSVKDGLNPAVSDTAWIYVYEDACDAARNGDDRYYQMDLYPEAPGVPDCLVDIRDLRVFASDWLEDYALTEEIPD